MKTQKYALSEVSKVVIGSNLSAVLYSYATDTPLIVNSSRAPFRFDLSRQARKVWSKLLFKMSLSGGLLVPSPCRRIKIDGTTLTAHSEKFKKKIKFQECHIFNEDNIDLENDFEVLEARYVVYDWMDVNSGCIHEYDEIPTPESFVNRIIFYPSERIDGNTPKKDLVAVSTLTRQELNEFEFSDTSARFKVQAMMREYKVAPNPKVTPSWREIIKGPVRKYRDSKRVKFREFSEEELINQYGKYIFE